ncbi:MAG: hypothetical protein LWY06_19895 [Firmicutes bacterium]|nr:hypothetical protein [Bacillota bacterium]
MKKLFGVFTCLILLFCFISCVKKDEEKPAELNTVNQAISSETDSQGAEKNVKPTDVAPAVQPTVSRDKHIPKPKTPSGDFAAPGNVYITTTPCDVVDENNSGGKNQKFDPKIPGAIR